MYLMTLVYKLGKVLCIRIWKIDQIETYFEALVGKVILFMVIFYSQYGDDFNGKLHQSVSFPLLWHKSWLIWLIQIDLIDLRLGY